MNYINVKSSQIEKVAYSPELKTLNIVFKGNREHVYQDISNELYIGLMTAKSVGSFFMKNIKDKYTCERI